jgi:EcsC protein family
MQIAPRESARNRTDVNSGYERNALVELQRWQEQMLRKPGLWNRATQGVQRKVNRYIPEKVHATVTTVIRQMTQAVITGANYTAPPPLQSGDLETREQLVTARIEVYRRTAAIEGGVTGAGGFFLGLADFPLLIAIKLKLLFEIAGLYGHSGEDYKERIYLLYAFQLAFSGDAHRRDIYLRMNDWQRQRESLPSSLDEFDWRTFQQQYRDYIDLAKLAQLVPVIGAPVGIVVNNWLLQKLGRTAMNAYRMRWFAQSSGSPT